MRLHIVQGLLFDTFKPIPEVAIDRTQVARKTLILIYSFRQTANCCVRRRAMRRVGQRC